MEFLYETIAAVTWQQVIMWCLGALLIFLAIKKDMEPALLLKRKSKDRKSTRLNSSHS